MASSAAVAVCRMCSPEQDTEPSFLFIGVDEDADFIHAFMNSAGLCSAWIRWTLAMEERVPWSA